MADIDYYHRSSSYYYWHVRRVALVYLYLKNKRRRRQARRRVWVNQINQKRSQFGEFHQLHQELRLDDGCFQRSFRLSRAQFEDVLSRIGERISRQDTNYRLSISSAERLSICLRFLATGDTYRTIARSFQVGASTVASIVPEVITAIWDCLVGDFMAVPSTEDWRSIAEDFHQRLNFPNCCGAVDGKHIVQKAPPISGSLTRNDKRKFSVVLLAVVDAHGRFRMIKVGGYGRMSDKNTLARSTFSQELSSSTLSLPADLPIPGAEHRGPLPHVFIADGSFPLQKNLMCPFPGGVLNPERRVFNYRLSRARQVVKDAFGVLSTQWQLLQRLTARRFEDVEKCVKTACLLHNFIRSSASQAPVEEVVASGEEPLRELGRLAANKSSREAILVRETFMAHFSAEGAVDSQPTE